MTSDYENLCRLIDNLRRWISEEYRSSHPEVRMFMRDDSELLLGIRALFEAKEAELERRFEIAKSGFEQELASAVKQIENQKAMYIKSSQKKKREFRMKAIAIFVVGILVGVGGLLAYQNPRKFGDQTKHMVDKAQQQVEEQKHDQCVKDFLADSHCYQSGSQQDCERAIRQACPSEN